MALSYVGQLRQGPQNNMDCSLGVVSSGVVSYIGASSWTTYEIYDGICNAHWSIPLDSYKQTLLGSYNGPLVMSVPAIPASYPTTYDMCGTWTTERFWGGGAYGRLFLTNQFGGNLFMLGVNKSHDSYHEWMWAPNVVDTYLWSDSTIICHANYKVEA